MPLETFYVKTVAIKRQTYIGDKSTFAIVSTVKGHLRPLSEEEASANGFQFGQAHSLQVPITVDIRKGDTVEIDSIEYNVSGVAVHDRPPTSVAHKRALLTLGQAV